MNKLDKIKEVQKFIESNKDKDLTWYADNNGIVSRRTFSYLLDFFTCFEKNINYKIKKICKTN